MLSLLNLNSANNAEAWEEETLVGSRWIFMYDSLASDFQTAKIIIYLEVQNLEVHKS